MPMSDLAHYVERLTPEELAALRPLMERELHPRGDTLFRQGETPSHLFVMHRGTVKMVRSSDVGRDIILELLFPGDVCGALCSLDSEPYGMSAVCLEEVELSRVPRGPFLEAAARLPGLLTKAVDVCRDKSRQQREMMTGMAVERAERRAARALLILAARLGSVTPRGIRMPMLLDRKELAEMIGTTPETAIRILGRMRAEGLLEERDHELVILEEAALRELAGL